MKEDENCYLKDTELHFCPFADEWRPRPNPIKEEEDGQKPEKGKGP